MTPVSVLTLVRNRQAHLDQLVDGLRRSRVAPAELVVVDMSDVPVTVSPTDWPIRIVRHETAAMPLARARNLAAAAASAQHLLFLDVDCIPLADCLGRMGEELDRHDALLCADVRYLGPGEASPGWTETGLLAAGLAHPVRRFPSEGIRAEPNPGLFWSLAFAIRKDRFTALDGFDEAYEGYGAEDTDFGFKARAAGLPLLFVGGAIACHQYHPSHQPPIQHLDDILRNAAIFHARWGEWPMAGWLRDFVAMGLVVRHGEAYRRARATTADDLARTLVTTPI